MERYCGCFGELVSGTMWTWVDAETRGDKNSSILRNSRGRRTKLMHAQTFVNSHLTGRYERGEVDSAACSVHDDSAAALLYRTQDNLRQLNALETILFGRNDTPRPLKIYDYKIKLEPQQNTEKY